MKKIYNEEWIDNIAIQQTSKNWLLKNLISTEQYERIKADFPEGFYRPGLFVKIGLFFFACVACAFFIGFASLFILDAADNMFTIVSIICCICFVVFLEYLIKNRKLFHSGVDNALLYAAIGTALTPLFLLFEHLEVWQYCVFIFIVLALAVYRYADLFMAIGAYVTIFTMLANLMMKFPLGKALLPFGIMLLSIVIYLFVKRINKAYYSDCKIIIEVLSLITFYLGGNYYVVREGNAFVSDLTYLFSPQIPFAPVFYFFTLIIPLFYIFWALKIKNRLILIVGLFTFVLSIVTYRYYFAFLTVAQGLALAGMLMILLAVFCIRFLKETKFGITDQPDGERKLANLEALLAAQYLGQSPHEKGLEFGGGDFGGGGAGTEY